MQQELHCYMYTCTCAVHIKPFTIYKESSDITEDCISGLLSALFTDGIYSVELVMADWWVIITLT